MQTVKLDPSESAWACQYVYDKKDVPLTEQIESFGWRILPELNRTELELLRTFSLIHEKNDVIYLKKEYGDRLQGVMDGVADQNTYRVMAQILVEWTLPGLLWYLRSILRNLSEATERYHVIAKEAAAAEIALEELKLLVR